MYFTISDNSSETDVRLIAEATGAKDLHNRPVHLVHVKLQPCSSATVDENHRKAISVHKGGGFQPSQVQILEIAIARSKVMNNDKMIGDKDLRNWRFI